jgi:hypothetical protein
MRAPDTDPAPDAPSLTALGDKKIRNAENAVKSPRNAFFRQPRGRSGGAAFPPATAAPQCETTLKERFAHAA